MNLIGLRLRSERERLGLKQDELGVAPKTQRFYEKGERAPDAAYLVGLAERGGDILYVLTGERSTGEEQQAFLSQDEATLLDAYRRIPESKRPAAMLVMQSMAEPGPSSAPETQRQPQPRRATGAETKRGSSGG